MTRRPIRIGIAGTHSTGKTEFLNLLRLRLHGAGLLVGNVQDLAAAARELGFPILTEHTYESTLWIMAEGMRRECEAALSSDVILIDRPIFDAVGYFEAALEFTGRTASAQQLEELHIIARAHLGAYNLVIGTEMDPTIELGEGRDANEEFRLSAAKHIEAFLMREAPDALILTSSNRADLLDQTETFITRCFADNSHPPK